MFTTLLAVEDWFGGGGMQLNAGVWGHGIELAPSPSPSVHSPCTAPWSGLDLRVGRRNVDLKMLRNVDIL